MSAGGVLAALLLLLGLCGCGAESVRSLRQVPDSVYACEVPADCRTVYERIAARARQAKRPAGGRNAVGKAKMPGGKRSGGSHRLRSLHRLERWLSPACALRHGGRRRKQD